MKKIIIVLTLLCMTFLISCSSSTSSDDSPTITFVHPQNNETINDSIYTIEVSVEDTKSILSVSIYVDSVCLYQSPSNKNYSCEWHTYWFTESYDHTIKVEALNSDDKTTTKSIDVTLSEQAYVAPKLLSPADNSTLQNPLNFSWTALPQTFQYEVYITINDTPFVNTTVDTTYSNSFLIYGPATWQVKAQNALGMESKLSELYHFILNETK